MMKFVASTTVSSGLRTILMHSCCKSAPVFKTCVGQNNWRLFIRDKAGSQLHPVCLLRHELPFLLADIDLWKFQKYGSFTVASLHFPADVRSFLNVSFIEWCTG
jgi:hypothetical protein